MNVVEYLDPNVRKYLRLRKVLRTIEVICLVALLIALLFSDRKDFVEIVSCMVAVVVIPEAFLSVQRWKIKLFIRCAKFYEEKDFVSYSELKAQAEEERDKLLLREYDPKLPVESLEFLQEVKSGDDYLSGRIRYFKFLCDELEKNLKRLNDLERLVNY